MELQGLFQSKILNLLLSFLPASAGVVVSLQKVIKNNTGLQS